MRISMLIAVLVIFGCGSKHEAQHNKPPASASTQGASLSHLASDIANIDIDAVNTMMCHNNAACIEKNKKYFAAPTKREALNHAIMINLERALTKGIVLERITDAVKNAEAISHKLAGISPATLQDVVSKDTIALLVCASTYDKSGAIGEEDCMYKLWLRKL